MDLPGVTFIFSVASSVQFSTSKDVPGKNQNLFCMKGHHYDIWVGGVFVCLFIKFLKSLLASLKIFLYLNHE